ncbi:L,D-transpeptidase [Prauserella cavernicola]|uniref:L,D-transpeptidase n=1 Tax=Prauserella cavernicola TaxID=2800127 RepID=A0A934QRZ1_9PSEU|nr:L,D-transpeptidase [Prauserella cavernicola]MBK1785088.1 L,D-transpeptidase [Prauserella cavernicola]
MDRSGTSPAHGRKRSTRLFALAGAALLALTVSACGGEAEEQAAVEPAAVSQEDLTKLPDATTFGTVEGAPSDPGGESTGRVVHPKKDLVVYKAVNGEPFAKLPTRQMGSPTWVPVVAEQGEWVQVLLPTRPNGASGWIHASDADLESAENTFAVNVDRENFEIEITENGESIGTWTIGIGTNEHPTPEGRAYIIASIEETVNDYSPIVLPLSYHSDSHETFGGGPGTVGIHTWPDDSFVGQANSDGCIRVTQEALDELVKLPLGTIVNIV